AQISRILSQSSDASLRAEGSGESDEDEEDLDDEDEDDDEDEEESESDSEESSVSDERPQALGDSSQPSNDEERALEERMFERYREALSRDLTRSQQIEASQQARLVMSDSAAKYLVEVFDLSAPSSRS